MTFGSLFSGVGGFDLGFERAGMECLWQCEIEKNAQKVLRQHWPHVELFNDVTKIGSAELRPVDVICGGFPCQDLSIAGKREGLAGARSGLWGEFRRVLEELRPEWCVIENVPGLLSSNKGQDFAVVLQGLEDIGYYVAWRVLDAQYYGVAQRRKRVFIVGHLGDGRAAQVLFESESLSWHTKPSREARKVAPTLSSSGAGTSRTGNERTEVEMLVEAIDVRNSRSNGSTSGTLQSKKSGGYSLNYQNPIHVVGPLTRASNAGGTMTQQDIPSGHVLVDELSTPWDAETKRIHDARGIAPTMAGSDGKGGQRTCYVADIAPSGTARDAKGERQDISEPSLVAVGHSGGAILKLNEVSNTLNGQTGSETTAMFNGALQNASVRRLTPTECARLQGFPDDHCSILSDSAQYRAYGNAVCANVAEWIGRRIYERI